MENKDFLKAIPERLKAIRRALSLNQTEFVKKTGINQSFFSDIENGKKTPSFDFIIRIADTFNVSLDYLLFGEGSIFRNDKDFLKELDEDVKELIGEIYAFPLDIQIEFMKLVVQALETIKKSMKKD